MFHQIFQPPNELKEIVRNFYVLESTPGEVIPKEYQSMADGSPEIIFQYKGGFREYENVHAYLRPQHSTYQRLNLENHMGLFGIRLYPHAIQQLFDVPSFELINKVFDLKELIKEHSYIERTIDSNNIENRIQVASLFLQHQSNGKPLDPMHKLVRLVMQSDGKIDLPDMRKFIGLSVRQFERRFRAIAGFTPKHYARMMRFQSTKRRYVSNSFDTLAELAQFCNYSDQSHFIREFKEFAGITPAQYFKLLDKEGDNECQIIKGLIIEKDKHVVAAA